MVSCHLPTVIVFLLPFQFEFLLFLFLACLLFFLTFRTMLNESGESGYPGPIPDLRGNAFSFSPLRVTLAVGLSCTGFIMLRYVLSIPTQRVFFIINGC